MDKKKSDGKTIKKAEATAKKATAKANHKKPMHHKKGQKPKVETRYVIGGIHLRLEENGKRSLQTDREFFWKIGRRTRNEGGDLVSRFPELGRVAIVETQYGWRPVVVVREQKVTGEAAVKAADELRHVNRFTKNDVHTYHVVRPFKKFLKDNNIKDPFAEAREAKAARKAEAAAKAKKAKAADKKTEE